MCVCVCACVSVCVCVRACVCEYAVLCLQEKDMPLEQLLALYGYQISQGGSPGEEKAVPSPQEAYATVPASLGGPSMEEWEEGEGHEKGVLCVTSNHH